MSKISIIMPVYNTESFLPYSIQSLINQTYKNIEIIIVDDHSNDGSKQIINEYQQKDGRIESFYFSERKGVGAARNYGMKQATGDFIYFIDSDDYIPEDTLRILKENIKQFDLIRGKARTTHFANSFAIVYDGVYRTKMFKENRFNLMKHNGSTSFLYRKSFIENYNLTFSEKAKLYSDYSFLIPAFLQAKDIPYIDEAIYFKRRRPDPIYNPSLSQLDNRMKVIEFITVYKEMKANYQHHLSHDFLDEQLLNIYRKEVLEILNEHAFENDLFELLQTAVDKISHKTMKKYDFILRREIKAIKKGNYKRFLRIQKQHNLLRGIRTGMKSKEDFKLLLYERLFMNLPIKNNLVVLESFSGKGYSDSPKYISQYLQANRKNYKQVWSFSEDTVSNPNNLLQVKRGSLRYYYYLARAKYWVINTRMPNNVKKRKETIYLQTWHGTPLKKLAGDQENVLMPGTNSERYKQNFSRETSKWDYLISPNAYSSEIFKRAFWYNNKTLEYGYPRNDILYNKNNSTDIAQIKEKMNLPKDKKIILYAPTWRDDEYYSRGNYKFDLQLNLDEMQKKLGDEHIIVLRMHYLIASNLDVSQYKGFVYDYSSYDDISELYLVSDILITDYSSVFFDYANLKRPILFYTYDFEKYRDELRGFYLDIETEVPGPLLMNTKEIISAILNSETLSEKYKEKYDAFYKRFCKWDNGEAAKNVVEHVFK